MGSKKIKRKKLKIRKLSKLQKSHDVKFKKSVKLKPNKEFFVDNIQNKKSLTDYKNYSRYFIGEKYISKVKHFSQIREEYFTFLKAVISDNCKYHDIALSEDLLENLSLELEQCALVACLQARIYEKCMTKIISDIEKCTKSKQIHSEVQKLLPASTQNVTVRHSKSPSELSESKTYYKIPTISTIRTDENFNFNENSWTEPDCISQNLIDYPYQNSFSNNNQICIQSQSLVNCDSYFADSHNPEYWDGVIEQQQLNEKCFNNYENSAVYTINVNEMENNIENSIACSNNFSQMENNQINKIENISVLPYQTTTEVKEIDPLLKSRNQLQKSVEANLNYTEKIHREKKVERDKAYIVQVLEGEGSPYDKFYDSLSDIENDAKENFDESNLLDRLEKMKELFGVEDEKDKSLSEKETTVLNENHNIKSTKEKPPVKKSNIWKYEKFIQLHKVTLLTREMSLERRQSNKRIFIELFGEDSDEENEKEYLSKEKYRVSCTERISSWVVKYLMPFYHEKRIIGRSVFKSLGQYISNSIVDKIQYPDEWTVKYLVSKFFPSRKRYVCNSDVLSFQLD